jgi:hypothetical protein
MAWVALPRSMPSPQDFALPAGSEDLPLLTPRQQALVDREMRRVQAARSWDGDLPVLLLERCWLRLTVLPVRDLARRLPTDVTAEAPELVRYRELLEAGHPAWCAQQIAWEEFGSQACREALRRHWQAQDRGNHGWTLQRYLELVRHYRHGIEHRRRRAVPLIVLARAGEDPRREGHRLLWLRPGGGDHARAMRHTCA